MNTSTTEPSLVLLPYRVEEESDDRIVIHSMTADVRLQLSPGFRLFLDGFAKPRTVSDFVNAHASDADEVELRAGVELLVDRGVLVEERWRDMLRDMRFEPATFAAFAFERAPLTRLLSEEAVDIAVLGVPADIATTGAPGARNGPAAIRFHTVQRSLDDGRFLDEATGEVRRVTLGRAFDVGDLHVRPGEGVAGLLPRIKNAAYLVGRRGATLIAVGGDHSITYPLLAGFVEGRRDAGVGRPLCVVHFDAHTDLPRTTFGPLDPPHTHASFMRHVIDDKLVQHVVQIGLRNIVPAPPPAAEVPLAVVPKTMSAARAMTVTREQLLALVPADLDLYVTIDIDVLDPAFAPHTGTPLPCGLSPWRLTELVEWLCEDRTLVGIDVTEVAGPASVENRTAATAAHVLHHALLRRFGKVEVSRA